MSSWELCQSQHQRHQEQRGTPRKGQKSKGENTVEHGGRKQHYAGQVQPVVHVRSVRMEKEARHPKEG